MKKNIGIMSWSLNAGGAERAVANLSKDLSEKYNVYILLFDSENIAYPYSGTVLGIGGKPGRNILSKGVNLIRRCIEIKRIKKKCNIHTMISFMPQLNIYNILTKGKDKAIVSIRNNMTQKGVSSLSRKLITWVGKKADMTVSLSEGVRQDLINNFGYDQNKVVTIYNSCDVNWFMQDSVEVDRLIESFDFTKPTIVTVGRMTYQKGQWHLLRAFSEVVKTIPDCQLVIFGQGELKETLQIYAKKLGVEKSVFMPGFVKNHHKFMKKCDVFVFPSLFEGLGNVLLEALACEMPIISTDCLSGPSEILNDSAPLDLKEMCKAKYGILVPTFSPSEFVIEDTSLESEDRTLANAILKVLTDNDLANAYRKQAKRRSKDFYPSMIQKQWIDMIEQ